MLTAVHDKRGLSAPLGVIARSHFNPCTPEHGFESSLEGHEYLAARICPPSEHELMQNLCRKMCST